MRRLVVEVNGYEIMEDTRKDNTNTYPFVIKYGTKFNEEYVFKTIKTATKWAEKH